MIRVCIVGGGLVSTQLALTLLRGATVTASPPRILEAPPEWVEPERILAPCPQGPAPNNRKGRRYNRHGGRE